MSDSNSPRTPDFSAGAAASPEQQHYAASFAPQPPQAPYPPQPGYAPQSVAQPPTPSGGGFGVAALVLGIIAFVIAFIPLINAGSFVLGGLGAVLAIVGLLLRRPKSMPIAGLIISAVAIITTIVMISVWSDAVDVAVGGLDSEATGATQVGVEPGAATEPDADSTATQAAEPTEASPYVVTIDGSHTTTDYDGNAAVVVDFTFTNNGDEDKSFMFAVDDKAFQNGVELEDVFVTDDPAYDSANLMKDIKPGASITVQEAYGLDDTSDVTVEVSELISFDDTLIASQVISVA